MTAERHDQRLVVHRAGRQTNVQDFGAFDTPINLSWACAVPLPGESPRRLRLRQRRHAVVLSVKIIDVPAGPPT